MIKENKELLLNYLDEILPNASCELNYSKDYELLLAVMFSAQTTDKKVNEATAKLFKKYDNLMDLNNISLEELEDSIRFIGLYKNKAKNAKKIIETLINEHNGVVPSDMDQLLALPGVGIKTANVVRAELFAIPAIAVDTHVERVSKRLKLATLKDDVLKVEKKLMKKFDKELWSKRHLQLVLFGRYYCKAVKPECETCRLKEICRDYKIIQKKKNRS